MDEPLVTIDLGYGVGYQLLHAALESLVARRQDCVVQRCGWVRRGKAVPFVGEKQLNVSPTAAACSTRRDLESEVRLDPGEVKRIRAGG